MSALIARRLAATVFGVAAVTAPTIGSAGAQSAPEGCPKGYQVLVVSELTLQGYQVPAQMDDPNSGFLSFGQPGNGDDRVCAQEIGHQTTSFGGQLYQFWDNVLPA